MNQRPLEKDQQFIPKGAKKKSTKPKEEVKPEDLVFDKAEEAESIEKMHQRKNELQEKIGELKDQMEDEVFEDKKEKIKSDIESLKQRIERLNQFIIEKQNSEK